MARKRGHKWEEFVASLGFFVAPVKVVEEEASADVVCGSGFPPVLLLLLLPLARDIPAIAVSRGSMGLRSKVHGSFDFTAVHWTCTGSASEVRPSFPLQTHRYLVPSGC